MKKISTKNIYLFCGFILMLALGICLQFINSESGKQTSASGIGLSSINSTIETSSNLSSESIIEIVVPQEQNDSVSAIENQNTTEQRLSSPAQQNISSTISQSSSSPISSTHDLAPVQEGSFVYAKLKEIKEPKESDFGEYYSYAAEIYQQYITGTYEEKVYEFASAEDAINFLDVFDEKCLGETGIALHRKYMTTNYGKAQMELSKTSIEYYQELMWKQNLIVSIVGNGISQRSVIENLIRWCVSNCSYDYGYQAHYVEGLLRDKMGICSDYANLVCEVCELYGIPCEYISSPDDGRAFLDRHAWNRVCLGGTWYYVDVTWSVCYGYNAYPLSEALWEDHYKYL